MSNITIQLSDFRAIKKAEVSISDVTIMAGPNGSGKSTISQLMNGLVNSINNFQHDLEVDIYRNFRRDMARIRRAIPDSESMRSLLASINDQQDDNVMFQIRNSLDVLNRVLVNMIGKEGIRDDVRRRIDYIIGEETLFSGSIEDRVQAYCDRLYDKYVTMSIELRQKQHARRTEDLISSIVSNYAQISGLPADFMLWEGNHPVVDRDHFSDLLSLHKSIYINTSISVASTGFDSSSSRIKDMVTSDLPASADAEANKILKQLSLLIGGEIYLDKEIGSFLKYKGRTGVNIYLEDAASGIQSLAILYRLLYAGMLDNETLLILDEPESHLHPQWIVALAKILLRINKQLGTKLLIASHCPDLVSAFYNLGKMYKMEGLQFYQSYLDGTDGKYVFKNCGGEISDIFESFNIALERIGDYGRMVSE